MKNLYMKFQVLSMHGSKVTGGIKKHDKRMNGQTSEKQYIPQPFLKLGHKALLTLNCGDLRALGRARATPLPRLSMVACLCSHV